MDIKFLGTGGAFDFSQGTSSAVVTIREKQILIDSGFSTILRLHETGFIDTIDYVLITHLHGDHVGSLPTLLQYCAYRRENGELPIIVPNDAFKEELQTFITSAYAAKQGNYVPITEFPELGCVDTKNQHVPGMQSYAYYFTDEDELIYFSGDINNAVTAARFLAERPETTKRVFHETTFSQDVVTHAHYKEVAEKLGQYKPYVYHVAKEDKPADCQLRLVEETPELLA